MAKKRYHVVRKQKADTRALLRCVAVAYLLYLAWQLAFVNKDASFPPAARIAAGILFAACALGYGAYIWRQYRAALKEAELTPEEEAALERDRDGGSGI